MASNRDKRRYAFQALYQFDAHGPTAGEQVSAWLGETAGLTAEERTEIYTLAVDAFAARDKADHEFRELAPTWPAHRQPAVDRAILRLAHFELARPGGMEKGRLIINDAIELTKEYSTDRSPSFVNGLLDKVYKRLGGGTTPATTGPTPSEAPSPGEAPSPTAK